MTEHDHPGRGSTAENREMQPEMPVLLTELVRRTLHPAMGEQGLRARGRQLWWEGSPETGYVVLEVQRWRYNTKQRVRFTVNTHAWPPGTSEIEAEILETEVQQPVAGAQAPIFTRPNDLDPGLREFRHRRWPLALLGRTPVPSDDFWWELTAKADLARVTDQVVRFCVERALPFAREHLGVDAAVPRVLEKPTIWGSIFAVALLERCRPSDPRLSTLIDELDGRWHDDARPPGLEPVLARWKRLASSG